MNFFYLLMENHMANFYLNNCEMKFQSVISSISTMMYLFRHEIMLHHKGIIAEG